MVGYHCRSDNEFASQLHPLGYDICQQCVEQPPDVYPYWQNFLFYQSKKIWNKDMFDYLYETATSPMGSKPLNSNVKRWDEMERTSEWAKNPDAWKTDEKVQNVLEYLNQIKNESSIKDGIDNIDIVRPSNLWWNIVFPVFFKGWNGFERDWVDNFIIDFDQIEDDDVVIIHYDGKEFYPRKYINTSFGGVFMVIPSNEWKYSHLQKIGRLLHQRYKKLEHKLDAQLDTENDQ